MARADEMRKLAKQSERQKAKVAERDTAKEKLQEEEDRKKARESFREKGRAEYLAEIRKAAKSGKRQVRLSVSSRSSGKPMSGWGQETLKLVEALLKEEGFSFQEYSRDYDDLSQGEGLPNDVGTEYGFDVSW